jgi:Tol biopolymer transport system component
MRCVIRWVLGAGVLALLLAAPNAMAAAPAGPRLAMFKLTEKRPPSGLLTVNPNGGRPVNLLKGGRRSRVVPDVFSSISWSPDGERVAFSGIVGFRDGDDHEPIRRIFTVRSDGSGVRVIRGTNGATGPVLSPDGRTVAFTRFVDRETPTTVGGKPREEFHGASIWTADLLTGAQRQLTPWQDGLEYIASSFSPDGSTLLATHDDSLLLSESEPVALKLDGSGSRRLLDDGSSAVYSPDGSQIALVRRIEEYGGDRAEDTDLFIVDADGTGVRRLTRTPGRAELFPGWDPSGERLAYVRFSAARTEAAAFGVGDALMQVNADGTCQTKVASAPRTAFYAPVWQPGPGRGAGRIEC